MCVCLIVLWALIGCDNPDDSKDTPADTGADGGECFTSVSVDVSKVVQPSWSADGHLLSCEASDSEVIIEPMDDSGRLVFPRVARGCYSVRLAYVTSPPECDWDVWTPAFEVACDPVVAVLDTSTTEFEGCVEDTDG